MTDREMEILLVESNREDANLAIQSLKEHKLANNIIHLTEGAEVLDFLFSEGKLTTRRTVSFPKVILLNLKISNIDGLELLRRIKSDPRTKIIPVVIITSSSQEPEIKMASELGANNYIVKPFSFNNFVKIVANLGMYWLVTDRI